MDNQSLLFPLAEFRPEVAPQTSSTFADNMRLPVHRWFRFSAGFSAAWAESVILDQVKQGGEVRVFDPFVGSATTLISAENQEVQSCGTEAHPFLHRIASAKLCRRTDVDEYRSLVGEVLQTARQTVHTDVDSYPKLIHKCFDATTLTELDVLRQAVESTQEESPASELVWLTFVAILRKTSHANTAQWQYVLPRKRKKNPSKPFSAFEAMANVVVEDMQHSRGNTGPAAQLLLGDARTCEGVPDGFATLVVTSPPYPNNYDYADATRLEMSFLREISGWGDLQGAVRQFLVRSCSQHVPERAVDLAEILERSEVEPIRNELASVCNELAEVRLTKGGRKTYHLMVACYFLDLARVWTSLRRVCASPCRVCFVIGDSAPYGVYVPVMEWLGELAVAAGFHNFTFEQTRERNIKWKNRKHRVPLCEGRLWVEG